MKPASPDHIAALLERIGRLLHADGHAEGLLPVQWEVLRYLDRANRFSRTPAAVTAYLGLTKGTVSQTLNTLESRGLIAKKVGPTDRRSRTLSLSARGRRLLASDPLTGIAAAITDLARSQQGELADSLESLLSARLTAQGRQPFGQCRNCRYFAARHAEGKPHYCQLLEEPLTASDRDAICHEQQPANIKAS